MTENMKTFICKQYGFELSIDPENKKIKVFAHFGQFCRPLGAERS